GLPGGGRGGRPGADGRGRLRVQARRGAHPGPQGRRRGARVHAPPAGGDRPRARDRGVGARAARARAGPGGRGHRVAPRREARALEAGHEGLMAKSLAAPYAAGQRGFSWLKLKQARTLDLVILAAEWGSGRRRGWLSNLHLGARDLASGQFVMLGKTFKGLTDEMLAWQTQRLLALETSRDAWTVYVQPELVVEVAFNDIQNSPHYPAGLALRFAHVRRYRTDKPPAQADTIETVRTIYQDGLSPRPMTAEPIHKY